MIKFKLIIIYEITKKLQRKKIDAFYILMSIVSLNELTIINGKF